MRDGEIVQSGKYNDLLAAGTDFGALVAAHNDAMELVEMEGDDDGSTADDLPLLNKQLSQRNSDLSQAPSGQKSLEKVGPGGRYIFHTLLSCFWLWNKCRNSEKHLKGAFYAQLLESLWLWFGPNFHHNYDSILVVEE